MAGAYYDGSENALDTWLTSAQGNLGIDFVFLSERYPLGVGLTTLLVRPASGNIFEGESSDLAI